MVTTLLVKNYQIKLLKSIWYTLLVLCTQFDLFSVQLYENQDN